MGGMNTPQEILSDGELRHTRDARGVHWLTLNSPATFNALGESMLQALQQAIAGVVADDTARAVVLGAEGKARHVQAHVAESRGQSGVASIRIGDANYEICSHSRLNDVKITGTVNGQPFTAQVERGTAKNPLALQVQHNGTRIEALVMSPRMAELHQLMPYKAPPDMSRFVLSPMPGLLVDVAVQPGQKVQAGERVAVIEAMKMENILFAAQDGVVRKVLASKGESLWVDQVIVEFE